jgi:putative oxidoreductase
MRTAVNICLIGVEDADEAGGNTMDNAKTYLVPLGRLLLASLFIYAGYTKLFVFGPGGTAGFFTKAGVPIPELAAWVAIIVELVGGILLLIGLQTRWVALALCIWCLITAFAYHLPDTAMMHDMNHFYKNLGLAGGFLYVFAYGAGAISVDRATGMEKA